MNNNKKKNCLHLMKGHKEAVGSIIFSNQGLLASLGLHDSTLQVYDVRTGQVLVKHNLKSSGIRACFTEDGSSVVTCGKGHFKSWSISHKAGSPSPYLNEKPVSLPKDFRSSSFVSVKSAVTTSSSTAPPSSGGVYALTSDGTLLLMRATGRSLSHHVSLQVSKAFDLAVSEGLVAAACEAGLVRVFASKTLQYQTSLPRPSAYSAADEEAYPDAVSVSFSPSDGRSLAVAYSDHSIIVYNVANCKKVSHVRVLSSHAGGIFAIKSSLDLLATASSDGSIKIWKSQGLVGPQHAHSLRGPRSQQRSTHNRPAAIKTQPLVKKGAIGQVCWTRDPSVRGDIQKKEREVSGIATGVCCLDISSDGSLLAAGDERGNIQVFDLRSMTLIITRDQVHDGRVQSISLSSDKVNT